MANIYQEMYNSKKVTIAEALSRIKSNDEIYVASSAEEPVAILRQMHTIKDRVENVNLWLSLSLEDYPFFANADEMRGHFFVNSWFYATPLRNAHKNRMASFQPGHLHSSGIRYLQRQVPRVWIGTVGPMDKHGYVKLSLGIASEKDFAEQADLVIAEVNPYMPDIGGDTEIHISDIDCVVEVDRPIPTLTDGVIADVDRTIGEYAASLVNDGDTIQLGIGSIPNAVAQAFYTKKDLGIHTEMITSSIVDLVEAGVITGKKKNLNKGKIVGAFSMGTQRLYDFLDGNPSVIMMRGSYVNSPFVVAQNDNMVSINTGLQVDLTGQICSESIGFRQYSGSGGQNDTAEGAIHAKNGRSIIALHSTVKNGTISTIQPSLSPGAVVTLSRNNIDYIITEYGIAPMKGRTVRERVNNLIAIAHPDFRKELRDAAEKYQIW